MTTMRRPRPLGFTGVLPADLFGRPPVDPDGPAEIPAPTGARRTGMVQAGLLFTYLACATTPWTAFRLGGPRAGDLFLLLAFGTLAVASLDIRLPRLPEWVWLFAGVITFIGLLHVVAPVSTEFLATRAFLNADGTVTLGSGSYNTNLGVLMKFLVPIVGLPLLFGVARKHDPRALTRAAMAFAIGSAISGFIAFTDVFLGTGISSAVTGIPAVDSRGPGLTEHPNYVAMACVFSLPLFLWQVLAPRGRDRVWALIGTFATLAGLYASGSRSGAGAGVAAMLLTFFLVPRYKKFLPTVGLISAFVAATAFVVEPGLGAAVLKATRLSGDAGEGSDLARTIVNDQAQRDFLHSPVFGVGLQVAGEAHIVYLQALAAGGVVLLTGYLIFLIGALVRCGRLFSVHPLAAPLFCSVLGGAIFNAAQDALTLRIVYVPATIAAALPLAAGARRLRRDRMDSVDKDAPQTYAPARDVVPVPRVQ